jgi:hypothetical protein
MHMTFLVVGLLVIAAGLVTIGFGIPINSLSLGNTLIVAGTISVGTGLILIALAAAVKELQRIADAVIGRSAAPRVTRSSLEVNESLAPPTARIPPTPSRMAPPSMAPKPPDTRDMRPPPEPRQPEFRSHEPRQPEPRHAVAAEPPGPLDWLRPKSKGPAAPSEPAMMEVPDEAPLSPPGPPRQVFPPSPLEGPPEPRPSRNPMADYPPPRSDARPIPRATPTVERPPERPANAGLFEVLWPNRGGQQPPGAEPPPADERLDMPLPPPPPAAARLREEREARESERASQAPPPPPPPPVERGPAILKSGVIDGMAYTLYADGSIEAELPQGTVKFASVDALRAHLERHS